MENNNETKTNNYLGNEAQETTKKTKFSGAEIVYLIVTAFVISGVSFFFGYQVRGFVSSSQNGFVTRNDSIVFMDDGKIVTNKIVEEDGKKFYVDENGNKLQNQYAKVDDRWYYFGENGEMLTNIMAVDNGKRVYAKESGVLANNEEINLNGNDFYFKSDCYAMQNEFRNDKDKTYYYGEDGVKVKDGWHKILDGTYYFDKDGVISKNKIIHEADGDYYVDINGKMVVNGYDQSQMHYYGSDGKMLHSTRLPDGNSVDTNGLVLKYKPPTTTAPTLPPTTAPINSGNSIIAPTETTTVVRNEALYISQKTTVKDVISDDSYDCNITYLKPTIAGKNATEVVEANNAVAEALDDLYNALSDRAEKQSQLPKSIVLNKVEVQTLSSTKFRIRWEGKLNPRTGTSRTVRYRMTFDREMLTYDGLEDLS